MQRLLRFFLLGPFFEAGALAAEAKFDDLGHLGHVLAALLDYPLHVAALCPDQSTGNLELTLVGNLNVVATSILG